MSRIPKMSARKLARFRSESAGAYPRSSITPSGKTGSKFYPAVKLLRAGNKTDAKIRKPIPSRKKRSTTPIRSKPFEGRLDKRSHWTASGNLKLFGKDKSAMRERIFERAYGWCQERTPEVVMNICGIDVHTTDKCHNRATEWSHKPCIHIKVGSGHGQGFKCDSDLCGAAECERCHRNSHGQY